MIGLETPPRVRNESHHRFRWTGLVGCGARGARFKASNVTAAEYACWIHAGVRRSRLVSERPHRSGARSSLESISRVLERSDLVRRCHTPVTGQAQGARAVKRFAFVVETAL